MLIRLALLAGYIDYLPRHAQRQLQHCSIAAIGVTQLEPKSYALLKAPVTILPHQSKSPFNPSHEHATAGQPLTKAVVAPRDHPRSLEVFYDV